MLREDRLATALALEREMYRALSEAAELTEELSEAVGRQDAVSVRLYLGMRREQLKRLGEQQELLERQCEGLPREDCVRFMELLTGKTAAGRPEEEPLVRQVERNGRLLDRIREMDREISRRLGKGRSYYHLP